MNSYNLDIYQGGNFNVTLRASNSDGTPINLSGYTVRSNLREFYSSTGAETSFTCTILNYESGIVKLSMTPSGTAALKCDQYVYCVECANAADTDVIKFLRGYAYVFPEATK